MVSRLPMMIHRGQCDLENPVVADGHIACSYLLDDGLPLTYPCDPNSLSLKELLL